MILASCALLAGAVLLAGPAGAADPGGANAPGDLLARVDAAWKDRDQPGKLEQIRRWLDEAEQAAPGDYGVQWRQARLYFWLSDDDLPEDEKSRLGKRAWDYGDRASKVDPKGVEGWYFAAAGMGNYALGIGVLKALTQGIEGKFKDRLSKAEAIQPNFFDGGVEVAWGRFYFKLPWPKHDAGASDRHLRKALELNPHNVRARLYLAEVYEEQGHTKVARKVLEDALLREPGIYDGPEERRSQKRARALLARLTR